MLFDFLPFEVLRVSLASVNTMRRLFPEYSDRIQVQVALSLHVAKEFVWTLKCRARQVLKLVCL